MFKQINVRLCAMYARAFVISKCLKYILGVYVCIECIRLIIERFLCRNRSNRHDTIEHLLEGFHDKYLKINISLVSAIFSLNEAK